MRLIGLALLLFLAEALVAAVPVKAGVSTAQIEAVDAAPRPDAAMPLDLGFRNEDGRKLTLGEAMGGLPAVIIFADYTCRTLCGPVLEFAAAGLAKAGLKPGVDYRLVVIGLDPRDGPEAARAMRAEHLGRKSPTNQAAVFLSGDESEIHQVTEAAGLHYFYDSQHDQFAHPAAVYVVDAKGRIRRVLSPLALDGSDLRLAIVDAGNGAVGSLADRIHLLCYGYDPVRGVYTERITTMLAFAAGATLFAMAGGIALMVARERRGVSP